MLILILMRSVRSLAPYVELKAPITVQFCSAMRLLQYVRREYLTNANK